MDRWLLVRHWFPGLPYQGRSQHGNRGLRRLHGPRGQRAVIATARFSQDAAADGNGAWIVWTHPARLFSRSQAITALALAGRLAAGYGDGDPCVVSWRHEP